LNGAQHSRIASFIWNIADDVLRDLYVRGKYRDVIVPMTVLRRLHAVLEPTKDAVLDMKTTLDRADITNQEQALRRRLVKRSTTRLPSHFASSRPRQPTEAQGRLH